MIEHWPCCPKNWNHRKIGPIGGAVGLRGAVSRHIFRDASFHSRCTERFPIPLPPIERAKVQLIAGTRGSYDACRKHFGTEATGSLMVITELRGVDHYRNPFCIGHVLPNGPFIHVLDEMTRALGSRAALNRE